MGVVAIPNWDPSGVLPPINQIAPTSVNRSPYSVSLTDLVLRFATTPDRQTVLAGYLGFRAALHSVGLTSGFQWIDGSFAEDIERIAGRGPNDIDVVTFYNLPPSQTAKDVFTAHQRLFTSKDTKADYHVDAYFVQLNAGSPEPLVNLSAYWYSLWSHRRGGQWKGYLQIDLSSSDDLLAKANLDGVMNHGGHS
jgi:hypothetical protein